MNNFLDPQLLNPLIHSALDLTTLTTSSRPYTGVQNILETYYHLNGISVIPKHWFLEYEVVNLFVNHLRYDLSDHNDPNIIPNLRLLNKLTIQTFEFLHRDVLFLKHRVKRG